MCMVSLPAVISIMMLLLRTLSLSFVETQWGEAHLTLKRLTITRIAPLSQVAYVLVDDPHIMLVILAALGKPFHEPYRDNRLCMCCLDVTGEVLTWCAYRREGKQKERQVIF